MKAEKFKTLCRRILNLEANGWKAEMPDDWEIMVFTRHGIEPLDSWMDEPHNKQILLCGESVNEVSADDKKMAGNLISELLNLKMRGLIKDTTYEKYKAWLKEIVRE